MPSSANQAVSTLTQTLALSIGVSTWSSSPGSRYWSAPAGSSASYDANTPSSSAAPAKVLSTPNATSPIGSPWVTVSLLVSSPPSPAGLWVSEQPDSSSKSSTTFLGRSKESCVTRTTSPHSPGAASSAPSSSVASEQPVPISAIADRGTARRIHM